MWKGWEQPLPWGCYGGRGLGNEEVRSTTRDFCFHIFSYPSPSGHFHLLQSLFSPLRFIAAGPCCVVVQGAEALPGVGASVRAASALPQCGQAPELLFKSHVVSWVRCRTAPGTPLFVFLNMSFYSVWILCQWRNYISCFKIPLLVKWMFHLYSEQLPLS